MGKIFKKIVGEEFYEGMMKPMDLKPLDSKEDKGELNDKQRINKIALLSLGFSLVSIIISGLLGIVGFILGIVALVQIKYTKESGKGIAITAIIIGFIWSFVIGVIGKLVELGY